MLILVLVDYNNIGLFASGGFLGAITFFAYFFSSRKGHLTYFALICSYFVLSSYDFYISVTKTGNQQVSFLSWQSVFICVLIVGTLSVMLLSVPNLWPKEVKQAIREYLKSFFRK